jgi:hypothetical protein
MDGITGENGIGIEGLEDQDSRYILMQIHNS